MSIEYVNRKGQTYYLYVGSTKTGKPKYYFSKKPGTGAPASSLPDGLEVYEKPDGQVFVRPTLPKLISDEELALVENEIARFSHLKYSLVERKLKELTVHAVDNQSSMIAWMKALGVASSDSDIDDVARKIWKYSPIMKFVLVDESRRTFRAYRYCFSGSINDWINIGAPAPLGKLAKKYIRHIETDEYFELY